MTVLYGDTMPRVFTPPLVRGRPGPCGCGCALTPVVTDDGTATGRYVSGSSWGFSVVDFAEQVIGMRFHPWQRWLMIHALEVLSNGDFRFRKILVLVARQNGKTSGVEIKNLWKLYVLQVPLVIGTAQNLDVAEESWDKCIEIIEGTEDLKAELVEVIKVNGKKAFRLASGGRYKVQAANRRGGRGLSAEDVNLDELREHQKWDAWGAVTKTTNAKLNAQVWSFSNAGDDQSVVLNHLQQAGRAAAENPEDADISMGHFEWSAPDETRCTCGRPSKDVPHRAGCALLDRRIQAMANPSAGYPGGILWTALQSDAQTDPDPVFLTECLCVRVADLSGKKIDPVKWRALGDKSSRRHGDVALCVDISPDREWSAIALYGHREDGVGHLQILDYLEGTSTLLGRLEEWRTALDPVAIGMQTNTFKSLRASLRVAKYRIPGELGDDPDPRRGDVLVINAGENAAACGQLIDAVRQGSLRHIPSVHATSAVALAGTRKVGDAVAWAPRDGESPILGLTVLTGARYAYYARVDLVVDDDYDPVSDIG